MMVALEQYTSGSASVNVLRRDLDGMHGDDGEGWCGDALSMR